MLSLWIDCKFNNSGYIVTKSKSRQLKQFEKYIFQIAAILLIRGMHNEMYKSILYNSPYFTAWYLVYIYSFKSKLQKMSYDPSFNWSSKNSFSKVLR